MKKREIKFRAWDKEEKEMVEVRQINWKDGIEKKTTTSFDSCWHEPIENFILMQYTGLKDKNGKEIYEGDIIYCNHHRRVDWIGAGFWFVDVVGNGKDIEPTIDEVKNWEIIGNIYENKELLK